MHLFAMILKGECEDRALGACPHAPALRTLVSSEGLLDPNPATRVTLQKLLAPYPCQP